MKLFTLKKTTPCAAIRYTGSATPVRRPSIDVRKSFYVSRLGAGIRISTEAIVFGTGEWVVSEQGAMSLLQTVWAGSLGVLSVSEGGGCVYPW